MEYCKNGIEHSYVLHRAYSFMNDNELKHDAWYMYNQGMTMNP